MTLVPFKGREEEDKGRILFRIKDKGKDDKDDRVIDRQNDDNILFKQMTSKYT